MLCSGGSGRPRRHRLRRPEHDDGGVIDSGVADLRREAQLGTVVLRSIRVLRRGRDAVLVGLKA